MRAVEHHLEAVLQQPDQASDLRELGQYVQNQYFDFLHGHQIDNKGVSAQGFSKQ